MPYITDSIGSEFGILHLFICLLFRYFSSMIYCLRQPWPRCSTCTNKPQSISHRQERIKKEIGVVLGEERTKDWLLDPTNQTTCVDRDDNTKNNDGIETMRKTAENDENKSFVNTKNHFRKRCKNCPISL